MKYENELSDRITMHDLKNNNWSSHIKKAGKSEYYILSLEDADLEAPLQVLDEKHAENLATFCRGYLLAWEYAQQQEEQSC